MSKNFILKNLYKWINLILSENEKIHKSEQFLLNEESKEIESRVSKVIFVENEDNFEIKNIKWPTIAEFTTDLGERKIDEFIRKVGY